MITRTLSGRTFGKASPKLWQYYMDLLRDEWRKGMQTAFRYY